MENRYLKQESVKNEKVGNERCQFKRENETRFKFEYSLHYRK